MRLSILLLALATPALAQDRLQALIVSGQNNHDCEWTTPRLEALLEASGKFEVAVTTQPGEDLATSDLRALDVIVLDYNGQRWGEAAERKFLAAVEGGVGVVVVHAANNAFRGWTEYETLVGDLWRNGTGHGPVYSNWFLIRLEEIHTCIYIKK